MQAPFGQVVTAMVTPFDAAGAVDYGQAWALARFLVDSGSDGVLVCGTTGESPTVSDDEKAGLLRTVVEAVGGEAKVLAGTGTYDTAHSIHMTELAAAAGCHGALAVTPYYSKPPQNGLLRHFTAIADATDLPVLLYNIPGRTSRRIEIETLVRLARHPQIAAVKDAVEDIGFTSRTVEAVGEDMAVYSGSDYITLPVLAVGGVGVVSVASHLAGPQIARMVAAATSGDWVEAQRLHHALMPLFDSLFLEPNPIPLKAGLNALWGKVGDPRLPLVSASDETRRRVEDALGRVQQI
ncbi:MAG: 4-hydroxy-tetrahydrodipicolinate synthase [Acidimicrobiia bacterium]